MFETWKLKAFDSLELVRSTGIQMDAPKHFHEGFSIGIALKGLQTLQLDKGDYIIEPGSLMFLDAREIHAHEQVAHSPWSHQMLYLSPDYIKWLQDEQMIHHKGELFFKMPLADDVKVYESFSTLHGQLTKGFADEQMTSCFNTAIADIFNRFSDNRPLNEKRVCVQKIDEIQHYLDRHFQVKLQLDDLSRRFKVDKYQLIRSFKRSKGVTPNEYLNIVRVEAAKKFIADGNSLVASAFASGYYDQSHFTHNFLKYTCFTPGQFQRSCIA